ncbi:MAG TPA: hypothetical protein VFQ44_00025 [Streptosporangiaceae bacterium]|nr:hypothetical protein [Streptosporangiaceae bacterium]
MAAVVAPAAILLAMSAAISSQASAATGGATPARPARPTRVAAPAAMPHAAAAAAALERARATGRRVVVAPDTTPTSVTAADPDGTFTNTVSALPVRVRRHGAWVRASARLIRARGALSPAAATEPVTLSAGGAGPMAELRGPHGQNLTLWFPGRLPVPTISGATAIYRSVRPGIDLRLTATTTGGITQTLVARTAAAAASHWLRAFTERYAASGGLRLRADRAGNVVAAGRDGVVFTAAPAAAFVPARADGQPRPVASAPGQPAAVGRAVVSDGEISEVVSGRALAHPAAFPLRVTVGFGPVSGSAAVTAIRRSGTMSPGAFPSPNTQRPTGYVEAQDVQGSGGCQDDKNWNSTSVTALGIGFQAWATCIGVYQSYYVFNTSGISNSWDILHMELNLTEIQGSWDACGGAAGVTKEPVYLHSLGASAGIGSGTDGANVATLGTSSLVDQVWPAANPNTSDNCANQPADFNVTSFASSINGASSWTFGVNGDDTDNPNAGQFMRLSDNPTLVTTFDEFPAAPTMAQSAPAMMDNPATADPNFGCVSSSDPSPVVPWIGAAASIQLNANFTAPLTGEEVEPGWKVWNAATTLVNQTNANTAAGSFPYTVSAPADGDQYYSQIWSTVNGNGQSFDPGETTQGPECSFAADQTPPAIPAVSSTAFPAAGSGQATTQVAPGASGTFSFTSSDPPPPGCGSSTPIAAAGFGGTASTCLAGGVYEFEYSLNQPLPDGGVTQVTTCPAGGTTAGAVAAVNSTGDPATSTSANPSATTTATSCQINVSQWGTNILYVDAVDAAGNISQTYLYEFYVPWNTATQVKPGDINSDGQPDLLTTDSSGNLVFFPGGTDPANGPVTASTVADSPEGDSWNDYVLAHRGTLTSGSTDDLLALNATDGDLYRYNNSWNTNQWPAGVAASPTAPMYEVSSDIVTEFYPACTAIPSGEGGAGSANCTGYPAPAGGWKSFTQIIAPGDAWAGAPNGSGVIDDTTQPSMLGVASNGSLWLFQGSGGQFTNPVQLGSTGWNNTTVMAAGTVNGVDTIWARINSGTDAGDIESFPLTVPSGQVPTINAAAPATLPAPADGTILVDPNGSAIDVPSGTFPALTATGPLSGSTCATSSADTSGCPGFFAEDTTGDMFYYAGQPATAAADALSGTRELVGDVGGTDQGTGIPSTGTAQNASYPGDYCKLTNVQNGGGGWRINSDGTMGGFYLNEGASFALGSQVECWFANGMHEKLVLQDNDGNLVFYQYFTPKTFGAGTANKSASTASFQTDGNFVVRNTTGTALWASGTHTYNHAVLVLQVDGNLVIYPFLSPSVALWASRTYDPAAG